MSDRPTEAQMFEMIHTMPSVKFKNKHGEEFTVSGFGGSVWVSGDEVTAMVAPKKTVRGYLPLFNPDFGLWSTNELYLIGQALVDLHHGSK